jgi:hypothetical protein
MTWYQDLANCNYFGQEAAEILRAVGWLSSKHAFPTGRVEHAVFLRLEELLADPWQPCAFAGVHECELCLYHCEAHGVNNVFIPGDGILFVAPELILHYMNAHGYRPPEEFCCAITKCPDMATPEYRRALLRCGGNKLLKPPRVGDGST